MVMSKSKRKNIEREQSYGGRRPKDYVPAHNHVMHIATWVAGENESEA